MNSVIHYLLVQNQYLLQIISFLFKFICKFIPLSQFSFYDYHSHEYQKFKIDKPPRIVKHEVWHYSVFANGKIQFVLEFLTIGTVF